MPSAYNNGIPISDNAQLSGAAFGAPEPPQYHHHHQQLYSHSNHHQHHHHQQHLLLEQQPHTTSTANPPAAVAAPFLVIQHHNPHHHHQQLQEHLLYPPADSIYCHGIPLTTNPPASVAAARPGASPPAVLLVSRGDELAAVYNIDDDDAAAYYAAASSRAPVTAPSNSRTASTSTRQQEKKQERYYSHHHQQQEQQRRRQHDQRQQEIQRLRQQQRNLQKIQQQQEQQKKQLVVLQAQQYHHPRNVTVSPIKVNTSTDDNDLPEEYTIHSRNPRTADVSNHDHLQKEAHHNRAVRGTNDGVVVRQTPPPPPPQQQQQEQRVVQRTHPSQQDYAQRLEEDDDQGSQDRLSQSNTLLPPLQLPPSALSKTSRHSQNELSHKRPNKKRKYKKNSSVTSILDTDSASASTAAASANTSTSSTNATQNKSSKRRNASHSKKAREETSEETSSNMSHSQYHHDLLVQIPIFQGNKEDAVSFTTVTHDESKDEKEMEQDHATEAASNKSLTSRESQDGANNDEREHIDDLSADRTSQGPSTVSMLIHERTGDGKEFEPGEAITPSDIYKIVVSVSSWVAEEMRLCHYGYLGSSSMELKKKTYESVSRAESAAVAIQKFATSVVFPNVLAAFAENSNMGCNDIRNVGSKMVTDSNASVVQDNDDYALKLYGRVVVAVLLNLREVLILNGMQLFGLEDDDREKSQVSNDEHTEDFAIKMRCLSTAIVLNSASGVKDEKTRQRVVDLFLDAIEKYDSGNEEFISCMKRLDVRAIGITPNGKIMKRYENIAYRVSYNVARLNHHLASKHSIPYSIKIPTSNAIFVVFAEQNMKHRSIERQSDGSRKKHILERYREKMRKILDS